jgi:hypothetical protein
MRSIARSIAIALCAAALTGTIGCTVCREQIVDETTSPDHAWTTRTTLRNCGRLSTETTNVYLQRADSRVRLGEIVVLVRHAHPLNISWSGRTELHVQCAGCGDDVRLVRASAHGITIAVAH